MPRANAYLYSKFFALNYHKNYPVTKQYIHMYNLIPGSDETPGGDDIPCQADLLPHLLVHPLQLPGPLQHYLLPLPGMLVG